MNEFFWPRLQPVHRPPNAPNWRKPAMWRRVVRMMVDWWRGESPRQCQTVEQLTTERDIAWCASGSASLENKILREALANVGMRVAECSRCGAPVYVGRVITPTSAEAVRTCNCGIRAAETVEG